MKKIITISEAGQLLKNGASVMIGGFLRCGTPARIIEEILKNDICNLTLIANDTSTPDYDRGKLVVNKRIKKRLSPISAPIPKPAAR